MCNWTSSLLKLCGGALLIVSASVSAGQTPGVASPWNGPWGGGYQMGAPYSPLASPYVQAGYPLAYPLQYGGAPSPGYGYGQQTLAQPLPGGGYILPPGAGGGMLPGAYDR